MDILNDSAKKILILTGPPGCGKNALLDLYCKVEDVEGIWFSDTKSLNIFDDSRSDVYPEDLDNLVSFLNRNATKAETD